MEANSSLIIDNLIKENLSLRNQLNDLEAMIDAVTGHSDGMEAELLEKIKAGESLFQIISKNIPVPFIIATEAGDILFASENTFKVFGYSKEDFLNKNSYSLYHDPEDRNELIRKLKENGRVDNYEVQLKKSDGSLFWVSLFSQPVRFKDQDCILTVNYDLTERKKAEEEKLALEKQLRQTQKMEAIGTLASGIAHDFNNILSIVFGKIELAVMMLPEQSKLKKYLEDALNAGNRAKSMIMQILAFCRQKEQERKPFKISHIVSEATRMIQSLTTSNIEIISRINTKNAIILGDPTQIHQVVVNLCSNATYALRERGGVIQISLNEIQFSESGVVERYFPELKPGNYVKLTVSDNGPGIEKAIIDRVFDPFFTTKSPREGTGMGLAIVHGIVHSHGGAVNVESQPGKGAAFHCYFPILAEVESFSEAETNYRVVKGNAQRILFVDDEEDIIETYGEILKELGYQVTTETDPHQALLLFQNHPDQFDLIITDNTMPRMQGKDLAESMLKIRPNIPIILCTGSDYSIDLNFIKQIGFRGFLLKPFTRFQITDLIWNVLNTPALPMK